MAKPLTGERRTDPPLLDTELIPEEEFRRKMAHILAVPKQELEQRLAEAEAEREKSGKPKRGPKKKTEK